MTRKAEHDCPTCTCGQIEIVWSDRAPFVYPSPEGFADVIVKWALDHSYDRGASFPYGIPEQVALKARPVVERHLSAIQPDWAHATVNMSEEQRQTFTADLLAALR